MPKFDERFNHYGEDKVQFFYALFMHGFSFNVLTQHFAVHVNHSLAPWARPAERSKHTANTLDLEEHFEQEQMDSLANAEGHVAQLTRTEVTVQPGDTLFKIASAMATQMKYVSEINHLPEKGPAILSIGQKLSLPSYTIKVKPADSTWKIAKRYEISQGLLKAFNNMPNDNIFVGQVIRIPVTNDRVWSLWKGHNVETLE